MTRRRHRYFLLIPGVALAVAGLWWLLVPPPLSPQEAPFVGAWDHRDTRVTPGDTTIVLEYRSDRTCCIHWMDRVTGAEINPSVSGRWWVEGGTLFADWNHVLDAYPPIRSLKDRLGIPGIRGGPERVQVLSFTGEELVLGDHLGKPVITYRRSTDSSER